MNTRQIGGLGVIFSSLRQQIGSYLSLPQSDRRHDSVPPSRSPFLTGWFDFNRDHIVGWTEDTIDPKNDNLTIFVTRGGNVLASAPVKEKAAVGWHFRIDTGSDILPEDLLYERVIVFVRDAHGGTQQLRLEGSTQIGLIRELLPGSPTAFFEVDFRDGGNSADHVLDGWSGQEPIHRWTDGDQSTLSVPSPPTAGDYELELHLWPFIVTNRIPEQRLQIIVGRDEVGCFSVTQQSYFRCRIPTVFDGNPVQLIIRFLHPDAARPADFGASGDGRRLALAFKKVRIVQSVFNAAR